METHHGGRADAASGRMAIAYAGLFLVLGGILTGAADGLAGQQAVAGQSHLASSRRQLSRARRNDRIVGGEGPQLLFVVSLHDAKTPGAAGVEHGTEDHHLARLNPGPPVLGVARHDLALLVAHV
jgi:hypothetical protein